MRRNKKTLHFILEKKNYFLPGSCDQIHFEGTAYCKDSWNVCYPHGVTGRSLLSPPLGYRCIALLRQLFQGGAVPLLPFTT